MITKMEWPTDLRSIVNMVLYDMEGYVQHVGEHYHYESEKRHECGPETPSWPCPNIVAYQKQLRKAGLR